MRKVAMGDPSLRLFRGLWTAAFCALAFAVVGCGSDKNDQPIDKECTRNEDCGIGYVCQYQKCVCLLCGDQDEADGSDTQDVEPETELADGDATEIETETEAEKEADTDQETESDVDFECSESVPDPQCIAQTKRYCRNGLVPHSLYFCNSTGGLSYCDQQYDCHYPNCGFYGTSERIIKYTCDLGCVSNPDPDKDVYCQEAPPDGDLDNDTDKDSDGVLDGDADETPETDTDTELPNHADGSPCSVNADCITGHLCLPDMSGDGKYCAPSGKCVSRIGVADGQPTLILNTGDRRCKSATSWVQCLSTGYWGYATECTKPKCEDVLFTPGQTCVAQGDNFAGCDPVTLPDPAYCPGNFRCHTTSYCWESCTLNTQCRTGYKCNYNASTPDDPANGTCIPLAGK